MAEKVQGSVKWFSNKKGYGFITPAEGSPISEDIFVHQSSIHCDGYRTLVSASLHIKLEVNLFQWSFRIFSVMLGVVCWVDLFMSFRRWYDRDEGWEVEFEIGHDDDGKAKAVNVTAPGGGPCTGVRKNRRRREGGGGGGAGAPAAAGGGGKGRPAANRNARAPAKPKEPFWHEVLTDDVKNSLKEKEVRTSTGTIDVAVGDARVKLGTQGYAAMAHAGGIIAEGKFECDAQGTATFTWEHCITFDEGSGSWVATADKAAQLLSSLSLSDANVVPVGTDETAETLWGEGKTDPKAALEEHGFLMRRVVLTPRRRR
ncbi:hypothetical protein HJC23_008532 [Cyclotella cryptica]|uniref:CSD domain-containing protein n=1 Tax=Cyclotella cryptica TaxID=29204 RepID=A0ABD3QWR0_9STRA